jgi:hypothetical protein
VKENDKYKEKQLIRRKNEEDTDIAKNGRHICTEI